MAPKVSFIIPVYNAERFVVEAVRSVLDQTFGDFECLLVYDPSSDGTLPLLRSLAREDSRVRVVRNREGKGVLGARNTGIRLAGGTYIAMMDADDVSLPRRMETQVGFLERHPEVGLVGSSNFSIYPDRDVFQGRPRSHDHVAAWMLFANVICNSSVLFRRAVLPRGRAFRVYPCEDYDLWLRLSLKTRLENLPEPLVRYRIHEGQSSVANADADRNTADRLRLGQLRALGFRVGREEEGSHAAICPPFRSPRPELLPGIRKWLLDLIGQNRSLKALREPALRQVARELFFQYCALSGRKGLSFYLASLPTPLAGVSALKASHFRAAARRFLRWRPS